MAQSVFPIPRASLGGLHAGWASFGDMLTGAARPDTVQPTGALARLRGLMRRLAGPTRTERALAEMPAYLLDDMGLDPADARPATEHSDAEAWVAIKSGVYPRR